MKNSALRDFLAVVERGSLRAAARQLGIAQSVMTRSIQELEKELGIALFERQPQGVALTPLGEVFLRRARAVRNELRLAQEELDQLRGEVHGQIRMCLSTSVHMALLPHALAPFRQRFPAVTLEIIDAVLPRVERQLKEGAIDFYIGPMHGELSSELGVEKLFDNRRAIFGRRGHPLAQARSLRDLTGMEWVSTSIAHKAEDELTLLFESHGLPAPRIVLQGHSALTFFYAMACSDLLMLLPAQWAQAALFHDLQALAVAEDLHAPPICIVQRSGLPLTPAAEYFCDMVRRAAVYTTAQRLPAGAAAIRRPQA